MTKTRRKCCIQDCEEPIKGRKVLCLLHYRRLDPETRLLISSLMLNSNYGDSIGIAQRFFAAEVEERLLTI